MKKFLYLIALVFLLSHVFSLQAQNLKQYDNGNYSKGKDTMAYRILFPDNFDPKKSYPILFFLHGRGESGSDNQKQLTHGANQFLHPKFRKDYPAIVVFPQCPADSYWANVDIRTIKDKREFHFVRGGKPTKAMHALLGMVDNLLDKPYIDPKQVYVGGLSMGGMGTYEILRRRTGKFAAAFAICGGDHVANVRKYKKIPLWIFHGEKDDVVPLAHSMTVVNQLKILGYEPKLTLYPEANHNSWDSAFAEPQLLPWLFSNRK